MASPADARIMNSPRRELLSINTATVRKQWALPDIIAGCARRGIRLISPWRDQVAAVGLKQTGIPGCSLRSAPVTPHTSASRLSAALSSKQ